MNPTPEPTPSCPYYNPFGGTRATFGKREYHIACARGYNAGIIGTEHNGIFILCHTSRTVLLDQHCATGQCWHDSVRLMSVMTQEISRISEMSEEEFRSFIKDRPRLRFDPFAEEEDSKTTKKIDLKLRKKYSVTSFVDSKYYKAKDKRALVHAFEKFCLAALHAKEESVILGSFTKAVYNFIHLKCGYIAHFDRLGFYDAQLNDRNSRLRAISLIAKNKSTYGYPISSNDGEEDMIQAIVDISKKYLQNAKNILPTA